MCSASSHTVKVLTNCRMIAVGMCCTRSSRRCMSQPSAGPATMLPSTASRKAGATACDGEAAGGHRADRQAIDQQRAGVIQQAFAFEDGQDALGRVERAQHRGGRNSIGRGDDGAKRDGRAPGQARQQRMRDSRDRRRGEAHGERPRGPRAAPSCRAGRARTRRRRRRAGPARRTRPAPVREAGLGSARRERRRAARRRSPGTPDRARPPAAPQPRGERRRRRWPGSARAPACA